MQPESSVRPELYLNRTDPDTAPKRVGAADWGPWSQSPWRPRPSDIRGWTRASIAGCPSTHARGQACGWRIGIRLGAVLAFGQAAHPDLAAQRFPVQHEGRLARRLDLLPLARAVIGVKHKSVILDLAQQHPLRTLGSPAVSTVASAMASGSFSSVAQARPSSAARSQTGRPPQKIHRDPSFVLLLPERPSSHMLERALPFAYTSNSTREMCEGQQMSTGLMAGKRG